MVLSYKCHTEVTRRTGLASLLDLIIKRRNALSEHVARLDETAHNTSTSHSDDSLIAAGNVTLLIWPRNNWLDQMLSDKSLPPADLWRLAVRRGHTRLTQRSQRTTR